jgi:hypothetical protein
MDLFEYYIKECADHPAFINVIKNLPPSLLAKIAHQYTINTENKNIMHVLINVPGVSDSRNISATINKNILRVKASCSSPIEKVYEYTIPLELNTTLTSMCKWSCKLEHGILDIGIFIPKESDDSINIKIL